MKNNLIDKKIKKRSQIFLNKKGYLLAESIIAIGAVSVGLMGIFGLLSKSLGLNKVVSNQFTAAYLAMEGVEIARSIVDANFIQGLPWNDGFTEVKSYELDYSSEKSDLATSAYVGKKLNFDSTAGLYSYTFGGTSTNFKRKITIGTVSFGDYEEINDEVRVVSEVSWIDKKGSNSVKVEDYFFDYRGI